MLHVMPKHALNVNQCYPKVDFTLKVRFTVEIGFSPNGQIQGQTRLSHESMLRVIPKRVLGANQCYPKMNFTPNG